MADITYTRTFSHNDWIDNKDVVQAGGEGGFNQKFHGLEAEFDKISAAFTQANTNIDNIQRVSFLQANPPITLAANTASSEFQVELYDRTNLPANVEKVYFPIIVFAAGSTRVFHTVIYRQAPANKIAVSIQFFNADPATPSQFAFRVLNLATQSS
jgi:hypothetical protein